MEYKYKYKLVYPIEGQYVHSDDSYKKCVKKCYNEFKQLDGGKSGLFGVKDLVTGHEYKYKLSNNNKLKIIDNQEGGGSSYRYRTGHDDRHHRHHRHHDRYYDELDEPDESDQRLRHYTSFFTQPNQPRSMAPGIIQEEMISHPPSHNLSIKVEKSPESPNPKLVIKEGNKKIMQDSNISSIDITDRYNYPYARRTVVRENYDPHELYDDRDWCILL
jgi:hypothetical protein